MDNRRMANEISALSQNPTSSGPRWTIACVIRFRERWSGDPVKPQIPHIGELGEIYTEKPTGDSSITVPAGGQT
jgi:hypothetical protein